MPLRKAVSRSGHAEALLERFPFVGVVAERVSKLEVKRRGADLMSGQVGRIRRLQGEGKICRHLVMRVEKRALSISQRGVGSMCRHSSEAIARAIQPGPGRPFESYIQKVTWNPQDWAVRNGTGGLVCASEQRFVIECCHAQYRNT